MWLCDVACSCVLIHAVIGHHHSKSFQIFQMFTVLLVWQSRNPSQNFACTACFAHWAQRARTNFLSYIALYNYPWWPSSCPYFSSTSTKQRLQQRQQAQQQLWRQQEWLAVYCLELDKQSLPFYWNSSALRFIAMVVTKNNFS